jgi:hypothetical protein
MINLVYKIIETIKNFCSSSFYVEMFLSFVKYFPIKYGQKMQYSFSRFSLYYFTKFELNLVYSQAPDT